MDRSTLKAIGVVGGIVLAVGVAMQFTPSAIAYRAAQKGVRSVLVSPATAEFPRSADIHIARTAPTKMQIIGYVDSENWLGATVRTYYWARVHRVGFAAWEPTRVDLGTPDEIIEKMRRVNEPEIRNPGWGR